MSNELNFNIEEELHEECGVFGMYDFDGADVASTIITDYLLYSTEARRAAELPSAIQKVPKGK